MSEHIQTFEPTDAYATPMPEKISHVAAVGVLSIFLGIFGLVTLPFAAEPNWADFSGLRGGQYGDHSPIGTWGVVSTTLYCGICLLALVGGSGCLHLRRWARPVMLGFGSLAVVMGIAGIYFHWKIIELAMNGQTLPTFAFHFTTIAEWAVWGYGTILGAYTLWTMMRADVKQAFADESAL